jgi:hypothetical protein
VARDAGFQEVQLPVTRGNWRCPAAGSRSGALLEPGEVLLMQIGSGEDSAAVRSQTICSLGVEEKLVR